MNFLNPAVLFGLIAAAVPLILHLLNLRKLKNIEFSSLQFLKEMQKNKIRRIKIKQILLLILRTLLIVSIVLAFARPAINSNVPGFESFAKTSNVIIVDNSFSMDLSDENGNRFNQVKHIIVEILMTMNEGDEIVVLEMANTDNSKIYEFARNIDFIKDAINKVQIAYRPADFDKSLKLASKIMENASNFSKNIFIVSDYQPNIFEQTEIDKIENNNTNVYILPVGNNSKNIKNCSIDSLNILSRIFQIGKSVELEAIIKNNSETDINGEIMELAFNQQNVAQRTFNLQATQIRNVPIGAIPTMSGTFSAYVNIENDAFIEDNKRYFGFLIPEKPDVALFTNNNAAADFINIAISETIKDGFANIKRFPSNQIASANLSQFDLVILATGNYSKSDFNLLKQYITDGGNAFIFANAEQDIDNFSEAMNDFGFGKVAVKTFSQTQPNQFTNTDKMHPLFEGVFKIDDNARGIVESPKIFKAMPALAGQSLIDMSGGAFLSENILGNGKILYCAVPPLTDWSNFPITGIFPVIIIRSTAYLGSHPELSYNFEVGKNTQIIIPNKYATSNNFKIIDPNGNEFIRQAANLPSGAVLNFDDMNIPGVYVIYNSNNVVVGLVAINLQSSESNFTKFDNDELLQKISVRWNVPPNIVIIKEMEDIAGSINRSRTGTELWRFFVVLALLLAATEMLIQKSSKKLIE